MPNSPGKCVLVTGGTGFIGGRLIEHLISKQHTHVRVLVQNFSNAQRIARFPVELIRGDITDPQFVRNAVHRCDVVYHCAYGKTFDPIRNRAITVDGTRCVLDAALREGVRQVVHLSTVMVYGLSTPDGNLDETAPRRRCGLPYGDSKMEAERIAFEYAQRHGLSVTILQPTAVYGPESPGYVIDVLRRLKTGLQILVNNGTGYCNLVYVDDVVRAMLLAAENERAGGEAFIISGERPVTWRDFYGRYEQMIGRSATINMSVAEAVAYCRSRQSRPRLTKEIWRLLRDHQVRERLLETAEVTTVKHTIRKLLPQVAWRGVKTLLRERSGTPGKDIKSTNGSIHGLKPELIAFLATKTWNRIDKAKRILGYEPGTGFEAGMNLTEAWARWANLLPPIRKGQPIEVKVSLRG